MGKKALLIILDGWGLSPNELGNGPMLAQTPVMDFVYSTYPKTSLSASGIEVGLNPGEPGNSEVGHLNIGAGRVVWENLPRIDQIIQSGEFAQNPTLTSAFENVLKNNSALHLIGIASDGGVHGHLRHMLTIIDLAAKKGIKNICVHFISDGRDTAASKAKDYIVELESEFRKVGAGRIATIIGRYFAMDRNKNWDRAKKAYDLFTTNTGTRFASPVEAIDANYKSGKTDEFIEPSVVGDPSSIKMGDSVIFCNYRNDRMIELMHLFYGEEGASFIPGVLAITMIQYERGQRFPAILPAINLENTICDLVSARGMTQFHTAETEKYAHVTYFFKAGNNQPLAGETDVVVPSKKVATYDLAPEMSAKEVTEELKKAIAKQFDFIVANYANGDMVGHTGILSAVLRACETIDHCLGEVLMSASNGGYDLYLTADHGNCETMIDELSGQAHTEHTTNPVPFVFMDFAKRPFQAVASDFSREQYIQFASGTPIGVLADLAPSILANLGLTKSAEMSGMDLTKPML